MKFQPKFIITYQRSNFLKTISKLINWIKFSFKAVSNFPSIFRYRGETFKQFYLLGNQALPLIISATVFISIVMTLETGKKLEPFGAKLMISRVVIIAVLRELGPVITGLMMAGGSAQKSFLKLEIWY